ncbi:hypothetical protein [Oxynema aestuarii]|jgi:hypothetical protein|uniref:Uncharacterized protein n=1 Tax=Oxynema aestuarii AP17 TaxID=2064643 RepID=A0A6H1U0N7_9CYAN|nr:hypothetical protein [Oxynema aestuarii]QIZ71179.1 hypothetical protein HCG48_11820 [Oxynema aestuarii AP17]RMH76972.1 MAG: hypothetical protein D6680_07115 [Cyanobacteria bacterium J007]
MAQSKPQIPPIDRMTEAILESNRITPQEHLQITRAMLDGKSLTDEDRRQINRIFEALQYGKIKVVYE